MSVRIEIDQSALRSQVAKINADAALRASHRIRDRAERNVRAAGRVDTGKMANGIVVVEEKGSSGMSQQSRVVSTAPHSAYQEFGTRAHGPVKAKMLRFTPKGSGTVVFAKWVRGVTPLRFMQRAYEASTPNDFLP